MSTPGDSKLAEPEERARFARVFDRGLNVPSGYVLPVQSMEFGGAENPAGSARNGLCAVVRCS